MKKRIVLTIAALVFATLAYAQEYIVIENVKGQTKQHDIDIIKRVYFETYEAKGTGTADDPFNVAAAIAKCKEFREIGSTEKFYIKGVVVSNASFPYGSASFYIADDAKGYNRFYCSCYGSDGSKLYSGINNIAIGDEIVLCASLLFYDGLTPMSGDESYIVTINGQKTNEFPNAAGDGTESNPFNVFAAILKCMETGSNPSAEKYYVKGIVDDGYTVDIYGNATFTLVDAEGADKKFQVWRLAAAGNKKIKEGYVIPKGATVVIYSSVYMYKGTTPESVQGEGYIVSVNGQTPKLAGESGE
ncbi:MAG: hypothetical protein IJS97_00980 [Prevotella sp.]|nr:hypothetical protein [Prevotella sp.]